MKTTKYSMEELMPIVARLAERYTSGESTSVTYEKARQLMGAVSYAIAIYEKECRMQKMMQVAVLAAAAGAEKTSAEAAYAEGYRLLCEKVKSVQACYNDVMANFQSFENENYRDTVESGLAAFFLYYDPMFDPENTIITMDYPVFADDRKKKGILAIEDYVRKIQLEQRFFSELDRDWCYGILNDYQKDYRAQYYNICSVILHHILARMIIGGNIINCDILAKWISTRSKEAIRQALKSCLHTLVQQKYADDQALLAYLAKDLPGFAAQLYENGKNGCLSQCFHVAMW